MSRKQKTIGLLGGMSWESTATYYRELNEGIKAKLGGLHSAKICYGQCRFCEEIRETATHRGLGWHCRYSCQRLPLAIEKGGADFLLICTNTMHKVAPQIEANISIPILHIADATAQRLREANIKKVGLLGTRFTMEQDFYKGRLVEKYGIDVIVPDRVRTRRYTCGHL